MIAPRILHLHSTFDLGGKEARAVRLMNAFGPAYRHDIVTAVAGAASAMAAISPEVEARLRRDLPPLQGRPTPRRLKRLAAAMRGYDLVLTYNFGALDAVFARRLFGGPPLVHHEDGFNEDERRRQKWRRVLYRRLALPAAHRLVVPSALLEELARRIWKRPFERVTRIPNGVAAARFAAAPDPQAIPGLEKRPDELVVGTLAGLRAVKNLPRLVEAYALAVRIHPAASRLVIVGEGPERGAIVAAAERAGVADRLVLPGFLPNPARYVGLFDIFALSSDSEQFPISLVEAMAAGLPAAATDVGDIRAILSEENRPLLARTADASALGRSLARLMGDAELRRRLGEANRARVSAEYDEAGMIAAYRSLYDEALGAKQSS